MVPIVTLTSCGGDGGGGGSDYSNDYSNDVSSSDSQLTNLNGRVFVANDGSMSQVINFKSGNKVTGIFTYGSERESSTGNYNNPVMLDATSASTTVKLDYSEGETEVWVIKYRIQDGKLKVFSATVDGFTVSASFSFS